MPLQKSLYGLKNGGWRWSPSSLNWVGYNLVELYTQYTYEKRWQKTSQKDALRMIEEEMPETDAQATLKYIISQIEKGKIITLVECRFSAKAIS